MKVRETMAFVGEPVAAPNMLIERLAASYYPLVLVANDSNHIETLSKRLFEQTPNADVEVLECAKEGCWEADIIVLNDILSVNDGLIEKIKAVANQKIVVYLIREEEQSPSMIEAVGQLQHRLSNTIGVQLILDSETKEFHIAGNKEATSIIENILNAIGFRSLISEIEA
ncbi:MAG: hypothetical protein JSS98_19400 [Bacteroidetes bacterium]|nr:hypothetical protein [Bacteroidota bacterium]